MRNTTASELRAASRNPSCDWENSGHLRRSLFIFFLCAISYWAIVISTLLHFHSNPLMIEGFRQHIISTPSIFTVGTLRFIITIASSVMTSILDYTAKTVFEIDLALRLQNGVSAKRFSRSWSTLTGSVKNLPNRYYLLLINTVIGGATISNQFGVYITTSLEKVSLDVTGADLDQLIIDGDVLPYYRDNRSSGSWFFTSMTISNLQTYHSKSNYSQSFDSLDQIYNSLARPADIFTDGDRGGIIYQHETAFGAPRQIVSYAPFYGDTPDNNIVSTCAQTFQKDSVSCKWYKKDTDEISNLKIDHPGGSATFKLNDPDLDGYSDGISVMINRTAKALLKELDSGDFAVIFGSIYDAESIPFSLIKAGPLPASSTSKLVSGRCIVRKEPFRFSPVSWRQVGNAQVALTASYEADTNICSNSNLDPNMLLHQANTTSAGFILAEHIAALLVPPEQNSQGLGWLLKSRLESTLRLSDESEDILTYVIRGLLAAGIASQSRHIDTVSTSAKVDAISYYRSFGVQGDIWVLMLLVFPALSTIFTMFFAIKLLFGERPAFDPGNLFEVTNLVLIPRIRHGGESEGIPQESPMKMKWIPEQSRLEYSVSSDRM